MRASTPGTAAIAVVLFYASWEKNGTSGHADAEGMRLLLVLAVGLLPVGVIMTWVGVGTIREQRILRRRGIKVPAVAERWMSQAGSFGVYRFLDTRGQTRLANADRVRTLPAAEVEIVYDPADSTVARERFGPAEVAIGVVSLFTGILVTATAMTAIVLAVIAFA